MIWLLRHGEAEDGSPDAERRLTAKGEQQARAAGKALAALDVEVDACLASPKLRAREMARLACEELGVVVTVERALEGGKFDPEELVAGLGEVLLVGHDPDFSQAVLDLTGARIQMSKGALAAVEDGELKALLRPGDLAALAR
jgi:phosphohistidine phosphatase